MKHIRLIILILSFYPCTSMLSQISHGGSPLFPENSYLRNSSKSFFIDMPSFDLDSILKDDQLNEGNMRSSYRFAHKFYTDLERGKSGLNYSLPDGTKIWQVGIRSKDAYSINILFSEFHLPEGGKLFIYNSNRTHIVGSFTHENNSENNILPIQPVEGEEIIIEYSEPAHADFEGKLKISEVNHDYRNFLRREPDIDTRQYLCMPDALCENTDENNVRSTVLLIIDGTTACTGSLINNTENDSIPYLLTAVHCLNTSAQFPKEMDFYVAKAGSIIAFFNYNRPVCGTTMKGTEEMSLAISYPRAIIEKKDIALLELADTPPAHYNAYYAGWNIATNGGSGPHTNLHHPSAAVKKYGITQQSISLTTIGSPLDKYFDKLSHWKVTSWDTGSTHGGSSGSPLFDNNHLIIGGLSGGSSTCNSASPGGGSDYFFALYKGWIVEGNPSNQLKTYLDRKNTGVSQYPGMDPNKSNPVIRISNAAYNQGDQLINEKLSNPNSGFLFGNSNLSTVEFAEEFNLKQTSEILGVYLLLPQMPFSYTSGVEINVYKGTSAPEELIATQTFIPQYKDYQSGSFIERDKTTNRAPTESFILFDQAVKANKKFFVSYRINYSEAAQFSVYNTQFRDQNQAGSAWLKDATQGWVRAIDYTYQPSQTSLAIQPLIRHTTDTGIPDIEKKKKEEILFNRHDLTLEIPSSETGVGQIAIYTISGQLLEKISFNQGESFFSLSPMPKGTLGIVRVSCEKNTYSGKIIY